MKALCLTSHFLADIASQIIDPESVLFVENRDAVLSRSLVQEIVSQSPDCILVSEPYETQLEILGNLIEETGGGTIPVHLHNPVRLDDVYHMLELLGKQLNNPERGLVLSHRVKAQIMDWCHSFYDRIRNKRVTLISSLEPLMLGGRWVPDMIRAASGHPQAQLAQSNDQPVTWADIVAFNPDVIIIAPKNQLFQETLKGFAQYELIPDWDKMYAVRRGDVFLTDGQKYFSEPSLAIIESMGVLISAMAGFESGFITPRDSSFKLRYVELHRHRFQ